MTWTAVMTVIDAGSRDIRRPNVWLRHTVCALCKDAGKPAGHRMGGPACPLPKNRKMRNLGGGTNGANFPATATGTPLPGNTSSQRTTIPQRMEVEIEAHLEQRPLREQRKEELTVSNVSN